MYKKIFMPQTRAGSTQLRQPRQPRTLLGGWLHFLHTCQPIFPHTYKPILVWFFRHTLVYIPPVKPILVWKFRQPLWEKSASKCTRKIFHVPKACGVDATSPIASTPHTFGEWAIHFCTHVSRFLPHIYKPYWPSKNVRSQKFLEMYCRQSLAKLTSRRARKICAYKCVRFFSMSQQRAGSTQLRQLRQPRTLLGGGLHFFWHLPTDFPAHL